MLLGAVVACAAVLYWAFFMYVLKPFFGFSFVHSPIRTTLYFLVGTIFITALFAQYTGALFDSLTWAALLFVFIIEIDLLPWLYRFGHGAFRRYIALSPAHPDLELLALEPAFLISKTADVLFQQTVVGTIIILLAPDIGIGLLSLILAGVFALGHLGLIFRLPQQWSAYFLVSSFVGGAFLPYLYLMVPGGFYYAIAIHMLWYGVSGVFYWCAEADRKGIRRG